MPVYLEGHMLYYIEESNHKSNKIEKNNQIKSTYILYVFIRTLQSFCYLLYNFHLNISY